MIRPPPRPPLFPSPTLSRSVAGHLELPPVELVQCVRADEPRGVSQRRGYDTPRRRVEHRVRPIPNAGNRNRSEEHTSELQSPCNLVCRLLLEKKKNMIIITA